MTIPLAHAGHWLPQLLYLAPVALLVALVGWGKVQERRGRRRALHGDDMNEQSPDDNVDDLDSPA